MGKGTIKTKAMTMAVAMSMVAGLCPSTAFAANSSDVAKIQDGTYKGTAECTPDEYEDFEKYDLSVEVTIENGVIKSIGNISGNGAEDNNTYITNAANGTKKNPTGVVQQIIDANGTDGINAVSRATCSSKAIVDAVNNALENATKKEENTVKTDALQAAITKAEGLTEADNTAESWKVMQDKLTAAKAALTANDQATVDAAAKALTDAMDALEPKTPEGQKEVYVLMNIPYADFYKADGVTGADAVSSATKQKTRGTIVAGSYHVNSDGSDITGVTFPVKISDASVLKNYTQITDESKVDITTKSKNGETTTTYTGKDALFESASYSYYVLSEAPSCYKEATVNSDGSLSFGEIKGAKVQTLSDATTKFSTSSRYGDYQLNISGLPSEIKTVYGVVISTKEGSKYGLRHLENIWKNGELAWSTGFVTQSKGNNLDYKDYAAMMGQTINRVTYYTDAGIYEIPMDQKVAKKFSGSVSVEDTSVNAKNTAITVSGLPEDFDEEYEINGLDKDAYTVDIVKTEKGTARTITFTKTPKKGRYTLTVSDKSGVYAPISTTFNLYTEAIPAKYNEDGKEPTLEKAEDASADEYQAYLKNIQSVTVNGKTYAASGKGAVTLITADGKLDLTKDAFKDAKAGDAYTVTVTENGYKEYTFTYKVPDENGEYSYVYVGMSWSEYWANENVYAAGSTESSEVKDSRNEYDKGAFDTVTRATANHGLHRGSFQCNTIIEDTNGGTHNLSYWTKNGEAVMTDGTVYTKSSNADKQAVFTAQDGSSFILKDYKVIGLKYVPVKVKTVDLGALKGKYTVVENGGELIGGYGESQLKSYKAIADVTANTNGLKTAEKQEDGSFTFSARTTGSYSGLKDTQLATADVTPTVKAGDGVGSYGEFIRVDFNGNYGGLGSAMQAVEWTYYGNDGTYTNPVRVFGTKFAADNWMHKSMGIQLGLTDSLRCQLPENTDGTGYWKITIYGLGYADYSCNFQVGTDNIATLKAASAEEIAALQAKIAEAKALNQSDYTAESWKKMQDELEESEDLLKSENPLKSEVNEQLTHLTEAMNSLEKVSQTAEYTYVFAGLGWSEYWAAEDVQAAGSTTSSDELDKKGETDKGAFDTVTRATTNHGLHRGSFQCTTLVYDTEGNAHSLVSWTADGKGAVFSDGKTYTKTTNDSTKITTFTAGDGTSFTFKNYNIIGWKYVPVKVKTADLEAFKEKYTVVENGGTLAGGYSEGELLKAYEGLVANVTENTNGLKTATKNEDGSFRFSAKQEGTESGIKDQELKTAGTAEEMGLEVQPAGGNFGEFLRVDLKKNYGDLGSNMQAVTWKYYGTDSTYGTALATYGTKFAADNWMHKSNGIQLGLTHSVRCQLPEGTDGTGYWTVTISALGYKDVTYKFEATEENIVKDAGQEEVDTAALEAAIAKAESLTESDYTADSWANMQAELGDARTALQEKVTQSAVDEATADLTAAIDALVKVKQPTEVDTSKLEAAIAEADTFKEADYTADSWAAYQAALQNARVALEAKESQEAVDNALATLSTAKGALVKADEQPVTVDTSSLEKAIADAKALKEADYTADSWKALQSALVEAQKALDVKESQGAVDSATNSLNKAIKALVKKDSSSVKKTDGTTNGSKTSGSDSVKTGDPANVLGWLGLAVSSLGAGMGGFAWKRRKRK